MPKLRGAVKFGQRGSNIESPCLRLIWKKLIMSSLKLLVKPGSQYDAGCLRNVRSVRSGASGVL